MDPRAGVAGDVQDIITTESREHKHILNLHTSSSKSTGTAAHWYSQSEEKDTYGPQRMNPTDFNDLKYLNIYLMHWPKNWSKVFKIKISNTLVYDQIPAKLMAFPSTSAELCV